MYRFSALAATFLAGLLVTAAAQAVSITNKDDREYKLTIIEGEKTRDESLKPNAVLEVCSSGCVVRLNDSENDEYELEGNEVVSIEDGLLYYDTPGTEPESSPGDGKASSPKP